MMTDNIELRTELEKRDRSELNIVSKRLHVRGTSRLNKPDVITRLLECDHNAVRRALEITWWNRHHKDVYVWATTGILAITNIVQLLAYRAQIAQYREQQTPELDCDYSYSHTHDTLSFTITNAGLADASNVWVEESIFMIIGDQVYEGVDVPHFNWIVYNGSRDRIWDIPRSDRDQEAELPGLQRRAFDYLMSRFQTTIISKWTISCTSTTSDKRYKYDEFFVHDLADRSPKRLEETTGGSLIRDQIMTYLSAGPVHHIRIFALTNDFELDAPIDFRISKDGTIHALHSWTKLTIEEFNDTFYWSSEAPPQVSDDITGSLRYTWKYTAGEWGKFTQIKGKTQVMTQVMTTAIGYLEADDRNRVLLDPNLLSKGTGDKTKAMELLRTTRDKFIKNRFK
ncbi:MAG: hypothetical protein ABFD90_19345 [Phycisphaerales bacterium]